MKLIVIFDDTVRKSEVIEDVIGEKGFSEVVVKRQRLGERFQQQLRVYFPEMEWQVVRIILSAMRSGQNSRFRNCLLLRKVTG